MSQATYRIVPLSIIRYGIEVTRPDKAARILLTCPSEDAANAWMAEIKRRSTTERQAAHKLVFRSERRRRAVAAGHRVGKPGLLKFRG